jgi:hypothetical protein
MDNTDESSVRWEMIKGVVFSQLAIVSTLINAQVISKEDVFNELEKFISLMTELHPGAVFFLEPAKTLRDAISTLPNEGDPSVIDFDSLFSDFTGNA